MRSRQSGESSRKKVCRPKRDEGVNDYIPGSLLLLLESDTKANNEMRMRKATYQLARRRVGATHGDIGILRGGIHLGEGWKN